MRLIVQKMEIHTEADDVDEDVDNYMDDKITVGVKGIGWSSPQLRYTLIKQAGVIGKWKAVSNIER